MRRVRGPKAGAVGDRKVESLEIILDHEAPPFDLSKDPLPQAAAYYRQRARAIVKALVACAPGGLVDAIFAELAANRASVVRGAHRFLAEHRAR